MTHPSRNVIMEPYLQRVAAEPSFREPLRVEITFRTMDGTALGSTPEEVVTPGDSVRWEYPADGLPVTTS